MTRRASPSHVFALVPASACLAIALPFAAARAQAGAPVPASNPTPAAPAGSAGSDGTGAQRASTSPAATPTPLIRLMPEPRPTRPPLPPTGATTTPPPAEMVKEQPLPPPRRRPVVLELTLLWPLQFMRTANAQGDATSYSLLGYGADGALCLGSTGCVLAGVASNLDPSTGGRLLSGVSLGAQGFLVGQPDPPPEAEKDARATRLPRLQSIWRVHGSASLCQKDYDFRSLYGDDADQVFVGARPELEGSFWCASGALGFDYLFRSGHRIGMGLNAFRSFKGSQSGLRVTGFSFDLRYQILRF